MVADLSSKFTGIFSAERHSAAIADRRRALTKLVSVLIILNLNYNAVSGWSAACSLCLLGSGVESELRIGAKE